MIAVSFLIIGCLVVSFVNSFQWILAKISLSDRIVNKEGLRVAGGGFRPG
jgi:hypothetical protein